MTATNGTLQIAPIETAEQLAHYRTLTEEFKAWDITMTREQGLDLTELLNIGYHAPVTGFPEEFAAPEGRLLLASYDAQPAGCGALRKLAPTVGEIKRVYVRPAFRGKGIARALMSTLLADARTIGYTSVRLATAGFMTEAQALYRSFGFQVIAPYYEVPDAFKATEIFMELVL